MGIHALIDRGGLISASATFPGAGEIRDCCPTGVWACDQVRRRCSATHQPPISQIVSTRALLTASPWLAGFRLGDLHSIAVSHGEGKIRGERGAGRRALRQRAGGLPVRRCRGQPRRPRRRSIPTVRSTPSRASSRATDRFWARWATRSVTNRICSRTSPAKEQSLFGNAVAYFRKSNTI